MPGTRPFIALLFAAVAVPAHAQLQSFMSYDDYPSEALRRGEEGKVKVDLTIGTNGRVKACTVIESSGSATLDSATCKLLTDRARFTPARDKGIAVESHFKTSINWQIER